MRKKPAKISHRKSTPSKKSGVFQDSYTRYVTIVFITLLALLLLTLFVKATTKVHVLGDSTGPVALSADAQVSPVPSADPSPMPQSGDQQAVSPAPQLSPTPQPTDTLVDCTGPDGKHFTTSFHDCQSINQQKNTFQFTPLNKPDGNTATGTDQVSPEPTGEATHQTIETPKAHLEVQTDGNKGQLSLETPGMHIEIKREDNGSITITAHKANGAEIQLQTNALDQINTVLKNKDVEVSQSSGTGLAIKSAGVQAETNLPISIDPTTKSLAVTTPNGTQDVATLPNQAVQSALSQGALTNVLTTANQTTPNAAAGNNTISLTELNNQPVYAIQGVSNKNLLGLFPVAFRKTVYVSSQDGQIVQIQQSALNQFLQFFSF